VKLGVKLTVTDPEQTKESKEQCSSNTYRTRAWLAIFLVEPKPTLNNLNISMFCG
jgi:hypothetical protein